MFIFTPDDSFYLPQLKFRNIWMRYHAAGLTITCGGTWSGMRENEQRKKLSYKYYLAS